MTSPSLLAVSIYASRNSRLIPEGISTEVVASMTRRVALTPVISLAAVGVSFVNILAARLVFLAIPLLHFSHQAIDSAWIETQDSNRNPTA